MTPVEHAMQKFCTGCNVDPRDFFIAWGTPPSVIAERLRKTGYKEVEADRIRKILESGLTSKEEWYLLTIAMYEMRNDINCALYGK